MDCNASGESFCNPLFVSLLYKIPGNPARPKFAYVANQGGNTIERYAISNDGYLANLGSTPVIAGPTNLALSPSSSTLYVANFAS
jgi:DNA-binding beta-propeller fold protein YncE